MVFEPIMSVEEYVIYDIISIINALRKNQSDKFYDLKYRCEIDGDQSYVIVWTESEEECLGIKYNNQTNTIRFGYPNDDELMNTEGECFLESFEMNVKPPVIEPATLGKWQYTLYNLIQEEVSKHINGVLKDELHRDFLTTIEL